MTTRSNGTTGVYSGPSHTCTIHGASPMTIISIGTTSAARPSSVRRYNRRSAMGSRTARRDITGNSVAIASVGTRSIRLGNRYADP
jgi:hypothetical protein